MADITDRRRKLTDEQREEIRRRYPAERQADLAAEFGVSVMTIRFVTNPALYERSRKATCERVKNRRIVDPAYRQRQNEYARERARALRAVAVGQEGE